MNESIHGHQVMEMMMQSDKVLGKAALIAEIAIKFGEETRFHTCSASDLSADELIQFFSSKGKVVETSEGISMAQSHHC